MANYYGKNKGFSYFNVPDKLLESRSKLEPFQMDMWLLVHSKIQHNRDGSTWKLLTDEEIAKDSMWGGRNISAREISRSRTLLKKLGLLSYRKDGLAYRYFVVNAQTGIPFDKEQAEIERKKAQKEPAESKEMAELRAELASLKEQMARVPAMSVPAMRVPVSVSEDYDPYDTGAVD